MFYEITSASDAESYLRWYDTNRIIYIENAKTDLKKISRSMPFIQLPHSEAFQLNQMAVLIAGNTTLLFGSCPKIVNTSRCATGGSTAGGTVMLPFR